MQTWIPDICDSSFSRDIILRKKTSDSGRIFRISSGFTLLELLVSIVLVTIMIVILGASMRISYRSFAGGEKKAESMERYRVSLRLMDSQLQSGISLPVKEEGGNRSVFIGKKDSMTFASNRSLFSGQRGYVITSYRITTDLNDKRTLFIEENTVGMENKKETKLLEGFEDIRFEYYQDDAMKGREGGTWVDEVKDETKLPPKVRVYLERGAKKLLLTIPVRVQELVLQSFSEGGA